MSLFFALGSMALGSVGCGDDAGTAAGGGGAGTTGPTTSATSTSTSSTATSGASGGGAPSSTSAASSSSGDGGAGGDGGASPGTGGSTGTGGSGGGPPLTVAACFADDFVTPPAPGDGPDYDQFSPVVGSHCMGTNHQAIEGIERVVFLGDSVTVGTPPTLSGDYYRSLVADGLAQRFGLEEPDALWRLVDPFSGQSISQESGDFASCSKWGARTDDLMPTQIPACFADDADFQKRTLVVMTMGGNDLSALTQAAIDGVPQDQLALQVDDFVLRLREAVAWLTEPGRFPNGVFVVLSNMYEFTDGTGEVESCDVSGLAGFDEPVPSPAELKDLVIHANEEFVRIAVDHGVDAIFLLEDFCGHGFQADDPSAPCYRGPGQEVWFDLTCIHPNPTGHQHITDMFLAVVDE